MMVTPIAKKGKFVDELARTFERRALGTSVFCHSLEKIY